MVDAARHPNIEILTYTEVERVDGYIGNFRVQVSRKPRYVHGRSLQWLRRMCARSAPSRCPTSSRRTSPHARPSDVPHGQAVPLRLR